MRFVRYRLKDILKCTGYYHRSPCLEFCNKVESLKLECCALTEQELQKMLNQVNCKMASYWHFARGSSGSKIILVIDNETVVDEIITHKMHEALLGISETYAHGAQTGEVLPIQISYLPKQQLLKNTHAQTKPKLISQHVFEEP